MNSKLNIIHHGIKFINKFNIMLKSVSSYHFHKEFTLYLLISTQILAKAQFFD